MEQPLRLAIYILAVYRLAQLIALDDGPYQVFDRLRHWAGMKAGVDGFWYNLSEFIHCPFCLGVWFSLLMLPLWIWPTLVGDILLLWWGAAGGQAFLEGFRDDRDSGS